MSEVVKKYDLPNSWEWCALDDVADVGAGNPAPQGENKFENGDMPFVRVRDMGKLGGQVRLHDVGDHVNEMGAKGLKIFKKGSVLFTKSGASTLLNQRAILGQDSYVVSHIAIAEPKDGVLSEWIYYWMKLVDFGKLAHGANMPSLPLSKAKFIPVPLAPSNQQKRIVGKIEELFSHIDAGIEALKKAKQLLKQYRQSVLKDAVTGELTKEWREANKAKLEPASQLLERIIAERENDYSRKIDEWEKELEGWRAAGEKGKKPAKPQKIKSLEDVTDSTISSLWKIPESWCWIKLGNLSVDVFDGPFGSNLKSKDYVEEGVRVIRLENIGSLEFKDEKVTYITEKKYEALNKHTVLKGDIIFSSFVADGTRVVVLPQNIEKAINKADCFCIRAFGDSIITDYLAHFLSTTSTYKRLENQVHGATRPRINTTQLKELEVPFCSDIEQKEIVRSTREKFEAIARLEAEIDHQLIKTEKNKQSILASAFSGGLE